MYKNVKAIKETLKETFEGMGIMVKDADEIAKIMASRVKKTVRKSVAAVDQITKPKYTIKLGYNQFIVPVKTGLGETGKGLKFNQKGILLYRSEEDTAIYIKKIAKKLGLNDTAKIVLPTEANAAQMFNNTAFREELRKADISWVPFINDNDDINRNVSLKEYFNNEDKFKLWYFSIDSGDWVFWPDDDPGYFDRGAVVLGVLK